MGMRGSAESLLKAAIQQLVEGLPRHTQGVVRCLLDSRADLAGFMIQEAPSPWAAFVREFDPQTMRHGQARIASHRDGGSAGARAGLIRSNLGNGRRAHGRGACLYASGHPELLDSEQQLFPATHPHLGVDAANMGAGCFDRGPCRSRDALGRLS